MKNIVDIINEEVDNYAKYLKWKRQNVTLRGIRESGSVENGGAAILGRGLYTAFLSNKALARQYGQVYFVYGAIPKKPKIFNTLNDWEIWEYNSLIYPYLKVHNMLRGEYGDKRDFFNVTTIEDEMQRLGYDGVIIKGREIVNYTPDQDKIRYFENENQLYNYFNDFIDGQSINEERINSCEPIKITSEISDEVNRYNSPEDLLKSGGLSIEALDRAAFGFSDEDIKTLMPKQLAIKWKDDLENVKYEVEVFRKKSNIQSIQSAMKLWAKAVDLSEPIDVSFEKGKFYIEDGHHRYYAAKILNLPLNVNLEINTNPIKILAPNLGYDDFHRCVFNQVKSSNI